MHQLIEILFSSVIPMRQSRMICLHASGDSDCINLIEFYMYGYREKYIEIKLKFTKHGPCMNT